MNPESFDPVALDRRGDAPPSDAPAAAHGLASEYAATPERDDKFLTTEHSALQAASNAAVAEGTGRASLYLTTISGTLVALSLIANAAHLGLVFFVFALVLFPSLFVIGLTTFQRAIETGIQNTLYIRGMNRIRRYYLEVAPQLRRHFILSTHDDSLGALYSMGLLDPGRRRWWEAMMTTAGMVAVVNSVLAGVFIGMVFRLCLNLFLTLSDGDLPSLFVTALVGLAAFLLSIWLHFRHQVKMWQLMNRMVEVEFPGAMPPGQHGPPH